MLRRLPAARHATRPRLGSQRRRGQPCARSWPAAPTRSPPAARCRRGTRSPRSAPSARSLRCRSRPPDMTTRRPSCAGPLTRTGLRSAVIAVATSMQESTLLNLNYGTSDSLGLFQQRPSSGWGTQAQIQHPAYAADAFLKALRSYQARNPDWAHQPLWQAAQGVQASAFPTAYAKWESQAAKVVVTVTKKLV